MTETSGTAEGPAESLEWWDVPEIKDHKIQKGQRILKCIFWKEKGSLGDGTECELVSAVREVCACDGLYNGMDLCLQIFTSGLWISEAHNNGLTTIVDDEYREQEMALNPPPFF